MDEKVIEPIEEVEEKPSVEDAMPSEVEAEAEEIEEAETEEVEEEESDE